MLTNRRVRVEVQKTLQEVQFEPLRVLMSIEGDIPDDCHVKDELDNLGIFLENCIYDQLERMTTT